MAAIVGVPTTLRMRVVIAEWLQVCRPIMSSGFDDVPLVRHVLHGG